MHPNFCYDVGFTGTGAFKNKRHISSQNQKNYFDFYKNVFNIDDNNNNKNKYFPAVFKTFQH